MEIWGDVPGYENLYLISSHGNVYSIVSRQLIKPIDNGNGYIYVTLHKNGRSKNMYIHRMVATLFLPNSKNLPVVNHKDFNRKNNQTENLEWCTQKQNIEHSKGNMVKPKNISHSKLGKGIRAKQGKFEVYICHTYGKRHNTLEEAKKVRDAIVKEYYG